MLGLRGGNRFPGNDHFLETMSAALYRMKLPYGKNAVLSYLDDWEGDVYRIVPGKARNCIRVHPRAAGVSARIYFMLNRWRMKATAASRAEDSRIHDRDYATNVSSANFIEVHDDAVSIPNSQLPGNSTSSAKRVRMMFEQQSCKTARFVYSQIFHGADRRKPKGDGACEDSDYDSEDAASDDSSGGEDYAANGDGKRRKAQKHHKSRSETKSRGEAVPKMTQQQLLDLLDKFGRITDPGHLRAVRRTRQGYPVIPLKTRVVRVVPKSANNLIAGHKVGVVRQIFRDSAEGGEFWYNIGSPHSVSDPDFTTLVAESKFLKQMELGKRWIVDFRNFKTSLTAEEKDIFLLPDEQEKQLAFPPFLARYVDQREGLHRRKAIISKFDERYGNRSFIEQQRRILSVYTAAVKTHLIECKKQLDDGVASFTQEQFDQVQRDKWKEWFPEMVRGSDKYRFCMLITLLFSIQIDDPKLKRLMEEVFSFAGGRYSHPVAWAADPGPIIQFLAARTSPASRRKLLSHAQESGREDSLLNSPAGMSTDKDHGEGMLQGEDGALGRGSCSYSVHESESDDGPGGRGDDGYVGISNGSAGVVEGDDVEGDDAEPGAESGAKNKDASTAASNGVKYGANFIVTKTRNAIFVSKQLLVLARLVRDRYGGEEKRLFLKEAHVIKREMEDTAQRYNLGESFRPENMGVPFPEQFVKAMEYESIFPATFSAVFCLLLLGYGLKCTNLFSECCYQHILVS